MILRSAHLVTAWLLMSAGLSVCAGFTVAFADETERDIRKKAGARESCRQDVAGLYLTAINDLDYARGTLAASQRSLATNAKALTKARQKFKASRARYLKSPENFRLKDLMDSDFFVVSQLEGQETHLAAIIAEQQAIQRRAAASKKHLTKTLSRSFRVRQANGSPYSVAISFKEPCGRFKYICPPSTAEAVTIRRAFEGHPLSVACSRFLGGSTP